MVGDHGRLGAFFIERSFWGCAGIGLISTGTSWPATVGQNIRHLPDLC